MRCSLKTRWKGGGRVESGGFENPRFALWTGIAGVISVSPSTVLNVPWVSGMVLGCRYLSVPQIRCSSTLVVGYWRE